MTLDSLTHEAMYSTLPQIYNIISLGFSPCIVIIMYSMLPHLCIIDNWGEPRPISWYIPTLAFCLSDFLYTCGYRKKVEFLNMLPDYIIFLLIIPTCLFIVKLLLACYLTFQF